MKNDLKFGYVDSRYCRRCKSTQLMHLKVQLDHIHVECKTCKATYDLPFVDVH
jgi:hypothetical protein